MSDDDGSMPFLDHLEDLRKVILKSLGTLGLAMIPAAIFSRFILDFIKRPLSHPDLQIDVDTFLQIPQVMGAFKILISVVFWSGLFLSLPFIIFFISGFVFPGLHDHERKVARSCSAAAVILFFVGASMGYFGTVSHALKALLITVPGWLGEKLEWIYLTDYVMFVLKLVIGFGLAFELPLVLLGLGYAGIVQTDQLKGKRRHVVVGLLFMAMMLTPPEPISQVIMASSLYVLYEVCIVLLKIHERKNVDA